MSWTTLHLASGAALFSGTAILSLGLIAMTGDRWWVRPAAVLLVIVGVLFVALSGTPLPGWSYALWASVVLVAVLATSRDARPRWAVPLCAAAVACGVAVLVAEGRHHRRRDVPRAPARALFVIGDSLSAPTGLGGDGAAWPELLARERGVRVVNLARGGATVASALRDLERRPASPLGDGVVLLEIGGNDQFGGTPAAEFEADLARLLKHVAAPGRVLVMFELPLLPSNNRYGRAQRRLAAGHRVVLIPKRYLVWLVSPTEATTDGVHLTPTGHHRAAAMVWDLIGGTFPG